MSDSTCFDRKIMIVDDNPQNVVLVEQFLKWAGYTNLRSVTNARLASSAFSEFGPDLVLLDLHMPGVSGYELLEEFRETLAEGAYVPILVFTADVTKTARKKALELGASDFLTKPGDPTEILLRVQNFLKARQMHLELENQNVLLEERVAERTRELEHARLETLECLAAAAEYRDDITGQHTQRVGRLSARIAAELGQSQAEVELIELAAPLHDVGKIGIPDAILQKPGKLTPLEFEEMKHHVLIGAGILSRGDSPVIRLAREIALSHHERWDGAGYCEGLSGEDIPLAARIVAVADTFDAMTNDRPYQKARAVEAAWDEIQRVSGSQFDPDVVQAFGRALGCRSQASLRAAS